MNLCSRHSDVRHWKSLICSTMTNGEQSIGDNRRAHSPVSKPLILGSAEMAGVRAFPPGLEW
jgi:hypothetical protein